MDEGRPSTVGQTDGHPLPPEFLADAPAELCGYRVIRRLSLPDAPPSFLADGPGGRPVVLKALDNECLLHKGALHPSIRDRLARVRELALLGVAALYGVERDAGWPQGGYTAWQVWEYVPGRTLDACAADPTRTDDGLAAVARELVFAVASLHDRGIVHGSIRGGNVIVGPDGGVRLTHVSPLLYTDPSEDVHGVVETLADAVARRGGEPTPFGRLVAAAAGDPGAVTLRALGAQLANLHARRDPSGEGHAERRREGRSRWRSVAGAAGAAGVGLAAAYAVWVFNGRPPLPGPKIVPDAADARPGR